MRIEEWSSCWLHFPALAVVPAHIRRQNGQIQGRAWKPNSPFRQLICLSACFLDSV